MVAIGRAFLLATALVVCTLAVVNASPISTAAPIVERRQGPTLTAPTGWKVSWNKAGRLSNGASTNFISLFTVDTSATAVTSAHVHACVAKCSTTAKCGFVNLIKMTGSSRGNVVCMLFPRYFASTLATYTTGPQSSGGQVNYSYGIRSDCAPVNGGSLTCTPAVVVTTTTTTARTTTTTARTTSTTARTTSTTARTTSTTARTTATTARTTSTSSTSRVGTVTSSSTTRTTSSTTSSTTTQRATPTYAGPWTYPTDNSLPTDPVGATLVEWPACSGSKLAVPAMLNQQFLQGSGASAAYISQHGAGSDFNNYFSHLYGVVGNNFPLIAPGFLTDDNSSAYFRTGVNLAWSSAGDSWAVGSDDTTGARCSSYDMYDTIIDYLAKSGKFPNLKTIYLVGHSGGGNFISRFSTINTNEPKTMKYVVANAANQAWFNSVRPSNVTGCDAAYAYPYQWAGTTNRYVSARFDGDASALFKRWSSRDVVFLVGDLDVDTSGTQSCQSLAQGGSYRRDRNYAYWAYQNLLAGTSADVSQFYGYSTMNDQGVTAIASGSFNHRECTVAGVGHDAPGLYQSTCGQAAIFGQSIPAGAGASYPATLAAGAGASSSATLPS